MLLITSFHLFYTYTTIAIVGTLFLLGLFGVFLILILDVFGFLGVLDILRLLDGVGSVAPGGSRPSAALQHAVKHVVSVDDGGEEVTLWGDRCYFVNWG